MAWRRVRGGDSKGRGIQRDKGAGGCWVAALAEGVRPTASFLRCFLTGPNRKQVVRPLWKAERPEVKPCQASCQLQALWYCSPCLIFFPSSYSRSNLSRHSHGAQHFWSHTPSD